MSTSESLTSHLVNLSTFRPYSTATEHDFLSAAGKGTLSKDLLSVFLSQDRLYAAHAYPKFIGRVLASVPFSTFDPIDSDKERFNQRVVKTLSGALQNVIREANFFSDTAKKYGLQLEGWRERKATRDYTAEMARIASTGRLEDGLIFLWAMERVYLDAWSYVSSLKGTSQGPVSDALAELVHNWTNEEFIIFVDELAELVNSLDVKPGSDAWVRAEDIWGRVIELEEAFWPPGENEIDFLKPL
ncbi:unnamed protein product [Somion occarium]|uniref:Thiaminase-2/PQQC domain-containing protein n=1 Tax=Somion occarium TaxID=3059160 RepID=A0ABP1CX80_9APHY